MMQHNSEADIIMTYNKTAWILHSTNWFILFLYRLDNDDYPVLALPIGIAVVACVIIAILTAAIIVLYRKLQKKGASDAVKVSTEGESNLSKISTEKLKMYWKTIRVIKNQTEKSFTPRVRKQFHVMYFTQCRQQTQLSKRLKPSLNPRWRFQLHAFW